MAVTETTAKELITGVKKTLQQMTFSVLLKNRGLFNNDDVANLDLLNPVILKQNLTNTLLEHVAHGRQDEAKAILVEFPELLLEKGTAIDITGENCECTAFTYAVWAMDTHMYKMMEDCIPENVQGKEIRKSLLEQAKAQTEHFDFMPLITALRTYVDNFIAWGLPQRKAHWCTVVGLAQQKLLAHVRQEYCNPDRSFYPVPSFTEKVFTRSLKFYNWVSSTWENWEGRPLGLGVDVAISGAWRGAADAWFAGGDRWCRGCVDLEAITALCEVRTADLNALMQRLETSMQKLDDVLEVASPMIP